MKKFVYRDNPVYKKMFSGGLYKYSLTYRLDELQDKISERYPDLTLIYSEPDDCFQIWRYENKKASYRKKSGFYEGDTIGIKLTYEQVKSHSYVLDLLQKLNWIKHREDLIDSLEHDEIERYKNYIKETEEYRNKIIDDYKSVLHSGAIYIPKRKGDKVEKVLRRF